MKKLLAMLLALCMVFALVACGGDPVDTGADNTGDVSGDTGTVETPGNDEPTYEDMGKILWLSNLTSGAQYDANMSYMGAICEALGYEFDVVYGDMMNDATGNLTAVQNAMTDDVVGLISSQDGGLQAIMEAYPELWVVGYNCDMRSVYAEDGLNHGCASNDHYLGTIADGYSNGFDLGTWVANRTIEQGYKKVAIINFPAFAYPNLTEADAGFRAAIEEYNATASEPIEIVGETTTLMFEPLSDQWFLEEGHSDLDAIIGLCAGVQFVYPTMVSAMANGTCSADTKLVTSGFETDPDIVADIGEDRRIDSLLISCAENPAYGLILIDNAVTGNVAAGSSNECIDSAPFFIGTVEDINNVMTKSLFGTLDYKDAIISVEEVVSLCGRNNPDLTWEELVAVFHSISVEDLK